MVELSNKNESTLSGVAAKHQQGIATVLVVVLMGVSMTAMALGLMYSLKNTQEKQVAVHASTHAQVGLWSGVEAFRRYLGAIPVADIEALGGVAQLNINFGGGYGSVSAKDVTVLKDGSLYHVGATIVNSHGDAKSSSSVGVMFEIDPSVSGGSSSSGNASAVINFYDSLELSGQVTFNLINGVGATINVEGNVQLANVNAVNLEQINATGGVTIGSGVQLDQIRSAKDVLLVGSAHANTVLAEGAVETQAGAGIDVIWANGAITLGGSGRSEIVNTLATITANAGSHGRLNAQGNVTVAKSNIDEIQTKANVSIVSPADGIQLSSVIAEGNLNCIAGSWGTITNLAINGDAGANCGTWPLSATDAGVNVAVMNPVTPFTMPPVIIDVWALKDQANYIFEYVGGKTKVTVNNINGVTNGAVFYVGDYDGPYKSYLCTTVVNGKCTAPATPGMPICLGHSKENSCISYGSMTINGKNSNGWSFNGAGTAMGVLWFDGSVNLSNGVNYATVLATGSVKTADGMELFSANNGGYEGVCLARGPALTYRLDNFTAMFEDQYPTNLCDINLGVYTPIQTGNIGIASGGYAGAPKVFSGGEVLLAANNKIYGTVLAGHSLNTGGQTVVYGYVTAAAQGGKVSAGAIANTLGANSTIDLTTTVSTFTPGDIPTMGVPPAPPRQPGPAHSDFKDRSKILWSRYL